MRAVVQRCKSGSVSVGGRVIGSVGHGYVVLLGVARADSESDATYIADKLIHLRVFEDENGKMNKSLIDTGGGILAVSQFTLYGDTRDGRRPSFTNAAPPDEALRLFEHFVGVLRSRGVQVETGEFGAHMVVEIVNDGPVTILMDSAKQF